MRLLVLPLTDTRRTLGVGVGAFVLPLLDWLPVQLPLLLPLPLLLGAFVGAAVEMRFALQYAAPGEHEPFR